MSLTDHDEFLHLAYPKNTKEKWKENYYFHYFDKDADAMGIFHFSHQRWDNKVRIMSAQCINGKQHLYIDFIDLPIVDQDVASGDFIVKSKHLSFSVVTAHKEHRVTFEKNGLSINLDFKARFPVVDFGSMVKSKTDKSLDIEHYEQGMHVEGVIEIDGATKAIRCFGHRDHSWGFRDESGLKGWHWIAILGEKSSWNLTRVNRVSSTDEQAGFCSNAIGTNFVTGLEVLNIKRNEQNEPIVCRYKGTLDNGKVITIVATRLYRLDLDTENVTVGYYENLSEFVIEETGERGVGIDEHMVLN